MRETLELLLSSRPLPVDEQEDNRRKQHPRHKQDSYAGDSSYGPGSLWHDSHSAVTVEKFGGSRFA